MTITKNEFLKIVNETRILKSDYALDSLVRLAHHSSAIEGNTLSLSDTITVIVDEMTPSHSKSVRELYEVANHREALADLLIELSEGKALSTQFVKILQGDLLDHLREDKGQFKKQQNAILGSNASLASPSETPYLMEQWVENYNWQLENLEENEVLHAISQSHIEFEKIHPFSDGNGRTGRMLVSYGTLKRFGVPTVITIEQRQEYLDMISAHDSDALSKLIEDVVSTEKKRQVIFDHQSSLDLHPSTYNEDKTKEEDELEM